LAIRDTEGLHKAIGLWLVDRPIPLNGAELRFLRIEMELSQRDLAGILGVKEQRLRILKKGVGTRSQVRRSTSSGNSFRIRHGQYFCPALARSGARLRETPKRLASGARMM
jgi:transcriptional regulator with XRE-family HTH domain